jgi:hypothetical protein
MGDDDHSTAEHDEECLPFALIPELAVPQTPLHPAEPIQKSTIISPTSPLDYPHHHEGSSHSHVSGGSCPPALSSSTISVPTDGESQTSASAFSTEFGASHCSLLASGSVQLNLGSQDLDTAASLLQPNPNSNSSLMLGSLFQLQPKGSSSGTSAIWQQTEHSSTTPTGTIAPASTIEPAMRYNAATTALVSPDQSVGFSQLMQEADNKHDVTTTAAATTANRSIGSISRLPVLPEEQSVLSSDSLILSSYHFLPNAGPASPLSAAPLFSSFSGTNVAASNSMSAEQRMASLAGATTKQTGANSFSVQVDIAAVHSGGTGTNNAAQVVMDILGNPDLLKLWCDPIHALVITKSSEGAQNAANRGNFQQQHQQQRQTSDREYEGEWIEATTPALEAPKAGYIQRASSMLAFYLGFPTYGKVTMFVERQRGRVGLTVGPFCGGFEVSHNLKILSEEDSGKIRIVDDVKLRRLGSDENGESHFCGVVDVLEKCYLPRLDDFMDQVLSSMARLRFLVEKGEEHSVYVEASGDGTTACTPLLQCLV